MIATVLIPTWNAPQTIGGAVRSALRQTQPDLEVLIVGDGVTADARVAIDALLDEPRVRFLDLPKGENRGERNRDTGVREASGDCIVYLADDDLLMPRHVANLTSSLATVPFAQSRNGFIDGDDRFVHWPTDLSDSRWVRWHLVDPPRNRVSITGTAHLKSAYLELETGWGVAPGGMWTDLYLWRQFFRQPDFRATTHHEVTTLQFPGEARSKVAAEDFVAQFARWESFSRERDAHERLQAMANESAIRQLVELSARLTDAELTFATLRESPSDVETLEQRLASAITAVEQLQEEAAAAELRARSAEHDLRALRHSRSWRVTAPLRRVAGGLRGERP